MRQRDIVPRQKQNVYNTLAEANAGNVSLSAPPPSPSFSLPARTDLTRPESCLSPYRAHTHTPSELSGMSSPLKKSKRKKKQC